MEMAGGNGAHGRAEEGEEAHGGSWVGGMEGGSEGGSWGRGEEEKEGEEEFAGGMEEVKDAHGRKGGREEDKLVELGGEGSWNEGGP